MHPRVSRALVSCALALVAGVPSSCRCRRDVTIKADDAGLPLDSAPPDEPRCPELVVTPYESADFPGALNSDHTPKTFPAGPPNEPGHALVLHYDDFGPQVMASELLGMDWWSWENGGSFEPGDSFDVRVVVYYGRELRDVQARYPTIEKKSDYRWIERDAALRYLDEQLADLDQMTAEDDGPSFASLKSGLARTRRTIVRCLGE